MKGKFIPCSGIFSILCGCIACMPAFAGDASSAPVVKMGKSESIKLEEEPVIGHDEAGSIKKLIDGLANISSPDFGLSPTMSGTAFAPVAGSQRAEAFLFTNHGLRTDPAFLQLVKLGPKALPFLLDALTNRTQTGLTITHEDFFGGMWYGSELSGNPANRNEQKLIGKSSHAQMPITEKTLLRTYRVTVGDVCFVIIGQIVGRPYAAVRYQPTAIVVINSPTEDPNLARKVRAIWSDLHPAQHLLDSLLLDYTTKGNFDGQTDAAMRLLYYFPRESSGLIAERLSHLDVGEVTNSKDGNAPTGDLQWFLHREANNGISTKDFIKAVTWCKDPQIEKQVQGVFQRTSDPEILDAAAISVRRTNPELEREKIEEFISKLPETEPGPYGQGYDLLLTLGKDAGIDAKPTFVKYMQRASLQRCRSMCQVLLKTQGQWSVELLAALLEDKRPAEGWTYAVVPGQNEPRLPIRICDEAAGTIAYNFPKLSFKQAGSHEDLDVQIETMRDRIARKDF
jgi:hypothetical protein